MSEPHIGIDFGAKRSGKTAACFRFEGEWFLEQSIKDTDADAFVQALIQTRDFRHIFMDAPMSLPSVYTGGEGDDYFYRRADREARAMSPMFLGGLTARAMQLKDTWIAQDRKVFEAYPAGLVRELGLKDSYKKNLPHFTLLLRENTGHDLPEPANWHQADAILAWLTGERVLTDRHLTLGDPAEGLICI